MKRKVLAIILVTVIALSIAAWFVHNQISELQNQIGQLQAQNSDLQDQIRELLSGNYTRVNIRIIAVNIGGDSPIGGLHIHSQVNVTVRNNHAYAVRGLILTTKLVDDSTGDVSGLPYDTHIDAIQAGESREIGTLVAWNLYKGNSTCVVTLKLSDFLLDEWNEPFIRI